MKQKTLFKKGLALMFVTLCSRILGLVREIVRALFLGTSSVSDAFSIAFLIPNLLRRLFAEGSTTAAFIPTLKSYIVEGDKEKTKEFISAFLTFAIIAVSIVTITGIWFSDTIIETFYTERLSADITKETIFLTRIMFPYLTFISIAAVFQGILNTHAIFTPSGFTPILFNVVIISATLLLSPYMANPARAMAVGVTAGGFVQMVFQIPFIIKTGTKLKLLAPLKAIKNRGSRKVLKLIAPTILGMGAYQINILISSIIAADTAEGAVSGLQYSNRLMELVLGIFAVSIGTVMLSELSDNAKRKEWEKFNKNIKLSLNMTALITIPAMIFALANGTEIISLLFKAGAFGDESVKMTAAIFAFHLPGLFFIAVTRVLSPAFYSKDDTKSPTYAGIIAVIANISAALLLAEKLGPAGIALAASISAVINTIVLFIFATQRKESSVKKESIIKPFKYAVKLLFFSTIAMAPLFMVKEHLMTMFNSSSRLISYGIPIVIETLAFGTIFIAILAVSKDENLKSLLSILKRKKES